MNINLKDCKMIVFRKLIPVDSPKRALVTRSSWSDGSSEPKISSYYFFLAILVDIFIKLSWAHFVTGNTFQLKMWVICGLLSRRGLKKSCHSKEHFWITRPVIQCLWMSCLRSIYWQQIQEFVAGFPKSNRCSGSENHMLLWFLWLVRCMKQLPDHLLVSLYDVYGRIVNVAS